MDLDELFAKRPDDPLAQLVRQDLDPLSVEELNERTEILEAEIARVRRKIETSVNFRASADAIFRGIALDAAPGTPDIEARRKKHAVFCP